MSFIELNSTDNWSELPKDVLLGIFNQCNLRDTIRMGAVCKSWLPVSKFSTGSRPRQLLPWLMMISKANSKSAKEEEEEALCFFSLSENTDYYMKSFPEIRGKCCYSANAGGWLLIMAKNLQTRLFHPWRRQQLLLPPPKTLSPWFQPRLGKVLRAAISDDAAVVVVIYGESQLAFCRTGDKKWSTIASWEYIYYFDVIFHKGQFYCVDMYGRLYRINTAEQCLESLTGGIANSMHFRTYLVADSISESLFIVRRRTLPHYLVEKLSYDTCKTFDFKVFEVESTETGEFREHLVQVESLGDRVIFLGHNSSMLFMASQFPQLKGNCIYFTDDYLCSNFVRFQDGCRDWGVFNMEYRTVEPLFLNRVRPTFLPHMWIGPPQVVVQDGEDDLMI